VRKSTDHIVLAIRRRPAIMRRFWSFVERSAEDDACWEWRGSEARDGRPVFHVGQSTISVARLAWLWSTGEYPAAGRLRRSCHNRQCLRPAHLVWTLSATTERRLVAASDGYIPLPGAEVSPDDSGVGMRRTYRVTGSPPEADALT
jgi:hypothetical protein